MYSAIWMSGATTRDSAVILLCQYHGRRAHHVGLCCGSKNGWPPIATAHQPMRASISIGLACNGATPIAIANATRPSIFAVDLRLLGLRLPASSRTITVWLTHIESTG